MSRKKPIKIHISRKITIDPEFISQTKVVKSGNGAAVPAYKKFIGMDAIVIIKDIDGALFTKEALEKYHRNEY